MVSKYLKCFCINVYLSPNRDLFVFNMLACLTLYSHVLIFKIMFTLVCLLFMNIAKMIIRGTGGAYYYTHVYQVKQEIL